MRLDFDFHATPRRPRRLALALALLGLIALAWAWSNWRAVEATQAGLQLQIAALNDTAPTRSARAPDPTTATAGTRVTAQLAHSWQPAFDALAAALSSKVALLSLDGSAGTSRLTLVAETRQLADAVAFIDTLQQQPAVARATLTRHELQADDQEQPVRVSVVVDLK